MLSNKQISKSAAIFAVIAICLVSAAFLLDAGRAVARGQNDFMDYYIYADELRHGIDMSDNKAYEDFFNSRAYSGEVISKPLERVGPLYTPVFYLFFVPFTFLPLAAAKTLWVFMQFCFTALFVYFSVKLFDISKDTGKTLLLVFTSLVFYPLYISLYMGQVAILILLLLTMALYFEKQNRPAAAGICLGLAIIVKIVPAFLLIVFFARKKWKAPAVAVLTYLAGLAISLPVLGIHHHLWSYGRLFTDYIHRNQTRFVPEVISFAAMVNRLFLSSEITTPVLNSPLLARVLIIGWQLFLLSAFVYACSRRRLKFEFLFSFSILIMTLLPPLMQEHYLAWLLLPYFIFLNSINFDVKSRLFWIWLASLILAGSRIYFSAFQISFHGVFTLLLSIKLFAVLLLLWLYLRAMRDNPSINSPA